MGDTPRSGVSVPSTALAFSLRIVRGASWDSDEIIELLVGLCNSVNAPMALPIFVELCDDVTGASDEFGILCRVSGLWFQRSPDALCHRWSYGDTGSSRYLPFG